MNYNFTTEWHSDDHLTMTMVIKDDSYKYDVRMRESEIDVKIHFPDFDEMSRTINISLRQLKAQKGSEAYAALLECYNQWLDRKLEKTFNMRD